MSKNFLIPTCLAAMVVAGGLAGLSSYQYIKGVNTDTFYASHASGLQNAALNSITLAIQAAGDVSYAGELEQVSAEVEAEMAALRKGSPNAGIAPVSESMAASIDYFDESWIKISSAIQKIGQSRGNNTNFERKAAEARQHALSLIEESKTAIYNLNASPSASPALKNTLNNAQENLAEGIDLLANASSPNSESVSLALEAAKAYVAELGSAGSSMPRDNALLDPLIKSFNTAKALINASARAKSSASGAVDNGPNIRVIMTERENAVAALNKLAAATHNLAKVRFFNSATILGSLGLLVIAVFGGVAMILRNARAHTITAQQMASSIQTNQKERSQELHQLIEEMQRVGHGDLRVEFTEGRDSTHEIAHTLNFVIPKLREIFKDVSQTIVSLSAASEQTLAMAKNTERSRNEQVQAIQHISHLVEELNKFTKDLDGVFDSTRQSSLTVGNHINTGSKAVHEVHDAVVKLAQSNMNVIHSAKAMAENIQGLVQLVDVVGRVASNSGTVAYNAWLVADAITDDEMSRKIRKSAEAMKQLTDNATEATEQINANLHAITSAAKDTQYVLEESQAEIKTLTETSANAIKAMTAIHEQVTLVVDGIISVAGQTKDLNKRSDEVADTMEKIHHYASDHSSASEQTATAISNLNTQAQRVGTTLAQFTV